MSILFCFSYFYFRSPVFTAATLIKFVTKISQSVVTYCYKRFSNFIGSWFKDSIAQSNRQLTRTYKRALCRRISCARNCTISLNRDTEFRKAYRIDTVCGATDSNIWLPRLKREFLTYGARAYTAACLLFVIKQVLLPILSIFIIWWMCVFVRFLSIFCCELRFIKSL